MTSRCTWLTRMFVWCITLPLLTLAAPWAACPSAAAGAAGSPIEQAQRQYDSAKFSEAVTTLREALSTGQVTGNDVVPARALMARALVKTGDRVEAKQAFLAVLRLDPAYRPDAVVVPPDEMEVFHLALKEVTAEQIQAGRRVPASIMFFYGTGSGDNEDFGEAIESEGGPSKMDNKPMFGGAVRFPIQPRWSLDLELMRLRATARDENDVEYEASSIPLVFNVVYAAMTSGKFRVNVFAGGGPMMSAKELAKIDFGGVKLTVFDEKTGAYLHGGLEGEWLPLRRLALTGRVLGRSATTKGFFDKTPTDYFLHDRKLEFSGFAASVGLRAYVGY